MYAQIDNSKDKPRLHKITVSGESEKVELFFPADIDLFLNTTIPPEKNLDDCDQDKIQELWDICALVVNAEQVLVWTLWLIHWSS